ncbi:PepSY domain-containing protein [Streptomyces indicus]|uniref:Peptidase propeptide and YPEB domain-containing protein n=1 Tax=Streptomyces indicus TaxID=417292 RepID=A0A1G9CJG1_9ACTN|nr:PepSY domain-containing protein [Streptomyces indicus]SDK51790.1 Peptidase propeptide and YPEB domain-containing protein [Streptomyces indicus]
MKRSNLVIAGVAVATLVAGGSAYAFATGTDTSTNSASSAARDDSRDDDRRGAQTTVNSAAQGSGPSAASDSRLTAAQAIDAALKAQSGTVVSADLDDDSDDSRHSRDWTVEVLGSGSTWYEIDVDAKTGKILSKETERDDDDDVREARAALKGSTVSAKQAAEIASAKGFVTSVDLDGDDDRGAQAWDVETTDDKGQERDWNVDLKSSRITEDLDDRDDRNGRDDADDRDDRADDRDDKDDADDRHDD